MDRDERQLVDVHGSCVSFTVVKDEADVRGIRESAVFKNHYFFSHTNHWGLMTAPFPVVPKDEDFAESQTPFMRRIIKNNLDKSVIEKLQNSEANWLMIDFYDSGRLQWYYPGGWFTHYALFKNATPGFSEVANAYILGGKKLDITKDEVLRECVHRYMDMVISKYGADHIILNRVRFSRSIIAEDKGIHDFGDGLDALGCYLDNQRVHDIEDYVLQNYPIHYLDISKYFVADWEHGHDAFPVHYEREYYEYADRLLARIVRGEIDYADTLDELAFAYKLDKDMIMDDGKDNWENYICTAEINFQVNPLMDELIAGFDFEELRTYRHELAATYRMLYNGKEYFEDASIPIAKKQEKLVGYFEELIRRG